MIHTTSDNPDLAETQALTSLALSFWAARAVMTAVDLGVFAKLAAGPCDAASLTSKLELHGRGARDLFDALVALGLLERNAGLYTNAGIASRYLDPSKPSYIGGLFEMTHRRLFPVWTKLEDALRSGEPQNEAIHQANYYKELGTDQDRLRVFLNGMTGLSAAASRAIAQHDLWRDFKTFVDVGGAEGGLAVQLAVRNEHLTGCVFDLPSVKPFCEDYVARFGVSDRVTFQPGDFFAQPLPTADVIVMGHVLHNWNLEQKQKLLASAYAALPPKGVLIVQEALIDDDRVANTMGFLMSLNMLLVTREGFAFTGAECAGWMREAGFRHTQVEHLTGHDWMIVATK
jgi:SAM-dependent methyltransferase